MNTPVVKAVIFDLFDTLVEITRPTHPFRSLVRQVPSLDARTKVMTLDLPARELAAAVDVDLDSLALTRFEQAVADEVASVRVFPEAARAIQRLRAAGLPVAVSSNLAMPYGCVTDRIHGIDVWNFSFETGMLKPAAEMFHRPARQMGVQPHECVMVGDSLPSDFEGATAAGLRAILLDRRGRYANQETAHNLNEAVDMILQTR